MKPLRFENDLSAVQIIIKSMIKLFSTVRQQLHGNNSCIVCSKK